MPLSRKSRAAALPLLCILSACQNDAITSYRAPKASQEAPVSAAPLPRDIEWTLPEGWQALPPSEMRVGSFSAAGNNGLSADISIVRLEGDAGGNLANVNRWRGQINLPPISEGDLAKNSRRISPGGRSMLLVDFVTADKFIDKKYDKRLVAAIYPRGGRTWFFKMSGEDALVRSLKPAWLKFLETLRFHDQTGA